LTIRKQRLTRWRNAGDHWRNRVSGKIPPEYFPDTSIDEDFVAFASFLFFDLKTGFDALPVIHEMTHSQTQQVRNPQSGVDPHGEKQ
jgi:hypothetical protein